MKLLELRSIECGYPDKPVIRDVSLEVAAGEFVGIIGPNGAGKTTLLRAITGSLKPLRGEILFEGTNIHSFSRIEFARQIATMPQLLETPFSFTVAEFVEMGRFPHRGRFGSLTPEDLAIVDESLALTDTLALRERPINELSGGERQRVLLAQALAQKPRLLLLDEPTAHLDIGHQVEILDLIRRFNRDAGLTVIVVLHDLNLTSEYCSRLVLLDGGKVYRNGGPESVLTYAAIEEVYRTVVVVKENPFSKKPYIIPVSQEYRNV